MRSPSSPSLPTRPLHQVILIQPLAAAKPATGAACNGCGVCCLSEPCPLGVLLSRSRLGPCKALQWVEATQQYRCGALRPGQAGRGLARLKDWVVRRWIGAGVGCDCDLEPVPAATIESSRARENGSPHD